jgi:hypothetical protein
VTVAVVVGPSGGLGGAAVDLTVVVVALTVVDVVLVVVEVLVVEVVLVDFGKVVEVDVVLPVVHGWPPT